MQRGTRMQRLAGLICGVFMAGCSQAGNTPSVPGDRQITESQTSGSVGRYQVVPTPTKQMMLWDTQTGEAWMLSQDKKSEFFFKIIPRGAGVLGFADIEKLRNAFDIVIKTDFGSPENFQSFIDARRSGSPEKIAAADEKMKKERIDRQAAFDSIRELLSKGEASGSVSGVSPEIMAQARAQDRAERLARAKKCFDAPGKAPQQ